MSIVAVCLVSACLAADSASLDSVVAAEWKANGVVPEALADDATYLRRVWLDLAGRVPPTAVVEKFLATQEPDKRHKLVDTLLASDEFANHWGRILTEHFTERRPFNEGDYNGLVLQEWFRESLKADKTYRDIATEIITATGASDESGPVNFLLRYEAEPIQLAGAVSKKFLGVSIQCAQCHHHPLAKWQKEDFWGLAAYFGRLRRMQPTGEVDDQFSLIVERTKGELQVRDMEAKPDDEGNYPQKSEFPRLPGAAHVDPTLQRREALARWITADTNPYFARNAVNLVWREIFGTPLAASFDKLTDEPESPRKAVLEHLTAHFTAKQTSLKDLLRTIVTSDVYQRGSGTQAVAAKDGEGRDERRVKQGELFGRYPLRPLSADQLYLSVVQATGYRGSEEAARIVETTDHDYITDVPQETFTDQPLSVHRALSLLNGDYVRDAINTATQTSLQKYGQTPGVEHIRALFLAALSRPPTADEVEQMLELAASGEDGMEDVIWVVLNSAEFCSNH